MKVESLKLTRKDHRCNAIRFLTKRYIETVNWTGFLRQYRLEWKFDSMEHTVLEEFWHGLGYQLHALLIQMAGYDYVGYIETHAVTSDVPAVRIEAALEKFVFKKGEKSKCRVRKST